MLETEDGKWRNALPVKKLKNGKKKMVTVDKKMILVCMHENQYFATEALCRHMRWPLAWGAKVEDDCIRCSITSNYAQNYRRRVGGMVPVSIISAIWKISWENVTSEELTIYETRVEDSQIQVYF